MCVTRFGDVTSVSEEVAALFEKEAEELLAKHGKRALAKALAALGGVTAAIQPRSLLDGRRGWSTICAHPQRPQPQVSCHLNLNPKPTAGTLHMCVFSLCLHSVFLLVFERLTGLRPVRMRMRMRMR